ncbi:MAG TPA: hypothetical protein VHQ03_08155 [Candidatus Dormibacteraeota bacterium]|nr:hypothetical protein [Candidatus Dormibacteraeota bacterium]
MSAKRRVHLQLPSDMEQEVREVGRQHGVGLGAAVRVLLRRGLDTEGTFGRSCHDCAAAVASLIAAEHSLLVVASILPQGRSLIVGLAADAATAAAERLASIAPRDADQGSAL